MKKTVTRFVRIVIVATFVLSLYGLHIWQSTVFATTMTTENKQVKNLVYKGKVIGKSNKARIILVQVGKSDKPQTVTVSFDKDSVGVEHATKGHGVIINYEARGKVFYAKLIRPKFAKLPQGVSLLQTAELKKIITNGANVVIVDSRPASRYSQSHIPGAISIPGGDLQELTDLLPKDKNAELVFYCGGPT